MPWKIEPRGGKFVVVNEQTGAVKGTFSTKPEAEAQLRALYANVPEAREEAGEAHDSPAEDAAEHSKRMRKGGPTGMVGKKKKMPPRRGSMNPPMNPMPPGPHTGEMP